MYYVNWCPHCVNTKPEFWKLMNSLERKNVNTRMIDCEKNYKMCEESGIEGYPTFLLNRNGEVHTYEGERTTVQFLEYLREMLQ